MGMVLSGRLLRKDSALVDALGRRLVRAKSQNRQLSALSASSSRWNCFIELEKAPKTAHRGKAIIDLGVGREHPLQYVADPRCLGCG
jgi:hypothetical protein